MAYEVLARKWRPQQFDDVVGQRHVTDTLKNAISSNRVAHAYLFVGPRGIGKTTSARIFAKALNCVEGPTATPCDKCDSCKEIMAGRSLDVIEIDGASNRGIDHIRDLRENVCYAPARGPFKIYIIDEVHMLTSESFNALLKTLEEPPSHVKFIFATTEPHKILPTILSRCQRFDLRPISTSEIIDLLQKISDAEKIDIDDDALLAIARGAEGGLRDAESALDQLVSFCGNKIREEDVMSVFGLVSRQSLESLVDAMIGGDIPQVITCVGEMADSGKDMVRVVHELLEYFRNLLVHICSGGKAEQPSLGATQQETLQRQADAVNAERVLKIVEILTDTASRLRFVLSKRTLLEVSLIRCSREATVVSIEEILGQINLLKQKLGAGSSRDDAVEKPAAYDLKKKTSVKPVAVKEDATPHAAPALVLNDETDTELLCAKWHEIVEKISQSAPMAKSYLLDAKPFKIENDIVYIGFDPEFAEETEKINISRNVRVIKQVLSRALGHDVRVEFSVLKTHDVLPADTPLKKVECAQSAESSSDEGVKKTRRNMSVQARRKWTEDAVVIRALETFGGDIVDIRE